jgi:hypothetical protein
VRALSVNSANRASKVFTARNCPMGRKTSAIGRAIAIGYAEVTGPLRYDADGLHAFAAACEQHALDVCVHDQPALPATGYQSTVGGGIRSACGDRKHRGCAIMRIRSTAFADREFVRRCAHGEHGHRHVVMAPSAPGPAPDTYAVPDSGLDTDHLETAATHWTATAARWRDGFTTVSSGIDRPGGTAWEGGSAEAASARTERDRVQVLGLADRLSDASSIARSGAAELTAAKTRALASVDNAQRAGFTVSEDLSVRDTLTVPSPPLRLVRDVQAQASAADIWAQSTILAATDQSVASRLTAIQAGFSEFSFRRRRRWSRLHRRFLSHHMNRKCGCLRRPRRRSEQSGPHIQPGTDKRRISIPAGRR